jgi:serine/threonine-protein kinase
MLREGEAMGVWRLGQALHASEGGQWYRARHALATEQTSVVLVLDHSERAADVMLRFADQAGDLGRLAHQAIAVPTDSGVTTGGAPYLVVEGADSACCKPILAACATLGLRERLQWLVQLCEALRYAHQQSWLLGEIDPAMLWIDSVDLRPLMMGVGLVRMPDPTDPFDRGVSLGATAGYQAPELLAGEPPSLATEAFGLGALLSVLVQGHLPVLTAVDLGLEFEDIAVEAAACNSGLEALWPALNEAELAGLQALLSPCAALDASDRYVSAEAIADTLREWLALLPTPAPISPVGGGIEIDFAAVLASVAAEGSLPPKSSAAPSTPMPAAPAAPIGWAATLGRRWRQAVGHLMGA